MPDDEDEKPLEFTREYFQRQGAIGGKLGGRARADKLTPAQRKRIAKKAAKARWAREKKANQKSAAEELREGSLANAELDRQVCADFASADAEPLEQEEQQQVKQPK